MESLEVSSIPELPLDFTNELQLGFGSILYSSYCKRYHSSCKKVDSQWESDAGGGSWWRFILCFRVTFYAALQWPAESHLHRWNGDLGSPKYCRGRLRTKQVTSLRIPARFTALFLLAAGSRDPLNPTQVTFGDIHPLLVTILVVTVWILRTTVPTARCVARPFEVHHERIHQAVFWGLVKGSLAVFAWKFVLVHSKLD